MLWASGNNANPAEITGSVLGVTAQLLDNLEDEERTKIQLAALFVSAPEIGISLIEAVAATRLLRKPQYASKPFIAQTADQVRRPLAENDLINYVDGLDFVRNHPKGAEAWDIITFGINAENGTAFARDLKTLQKVADMVSEGSAFRSRYPTTWLDELTEIIEKNKDLRCGSCGNGGITRVPPMDEMLDNVNHMMQYGDKPGFNSVMSAIKGNVNYRDGIHHMIDYMKKNPSEFSNIVEFEFRYSDDILNRADVLVGNTKYEFKSWTPDTPNPWNAFFSGSGNSYTQFTRYLENSNTLSELKYIFNGTKASETQVKEAFKELFVAKKVEIFNVIWSNVNLRNSLLNNPIDEIQGLQRFTNLINELGDPNISNPKLYSFLKSE